MSINYELRIEYGEAVQCDSCHSGVPLAGFQWGPPFTVKRDRPQRLLCQFCSNTMAGRHTEAPATDTESYIRAEVWRAAGAIFNALKYGLPPSSMTRWIGSTDPADLTGTATYTVGATTAEIRLDDFTTAQLIERLIDTARLQGAAEARRAAANYLRGAAANLEST